MRLAVVSDIHGNLPALEAVVADARRRGVDAIVNLGDSLSGPLLPRETADYLMASGWVHLAGNHERQILEEPAPRGTSDAYARSCLRSDQLRWIAGLRPSLEYAPDVLLCHGTPASDLVYLLESVDESGMRLASRVEIEERLGACTTALVLCGHSHVPRAARTMQGQLVVNPGSVGLPGFLANEPHPHRVANASPDARYAIVERHAGVWRAALLSVPYAFDAMVECARRRNKPVWAQALGTGYPDLGS